MSWEVYQSIGISLALGLLVGLQREYSKTANAGIRTFPLISLLGTTCAILSDDMTGWLPAAALLSVALMFIVSNFSRIGDEEADLGITTEAAALLMFVVGLMVGEQYTGPAIVTTGIAAVLLHWKRRLHRFVGHLSEGDIRGLMHLVLIALVILPVLPDETYGPYDVLNPYSIWRIVVLIVGISMAAYVVYKFVGPSAGAVLGGILGGLISSTATTVSYARQSKSDDSIASVSALVILIASTILNARVMFEVGVVSPGLLKVAAWPIGIMLLLMTVECVVFFLLVRSDSANAPEQKNPAQLAPAIIFGALYAVILFAVAAAKDLFGNQALYWIAVISGLTDVDAITLSTAKLFNDGRVDSATAWRVILIATMSNLVFKAGAVGILGSRRAFWYVLLLFGIAMIGGGALLLWWQEIQLPIPEEMLEQISTPESQSESTE